MVISGPFPLLREVSLRSVHSAAAARQASVTAPSSQCHHRLASPRSRSFRIRVRSASGGTSSAFLRNCSLPSPGSFCYCNGPGVRQAGAPESTATRRGSGGHATDLPASPFPASLDPASSKATSAAAMTVYYGVLARPGRPESRRCGRRRFRRPRRRHRADDGLQCHASVVRSGMVEARPRMLPAESWSTCFSRLSRPLALAIVDVSPRRRPGRRGRRPSGEPVIGSTGPDSARRPWPRWG
jgi:hypothetical protein